MSRFFIGALIVLVFLAGAAPASAACACNYVAQQCNTWLAKCNACLDGWFPFTCGDECATASAYCDAWANCEENCWRELQEPPENCPVVVDLDRNGFHFTDLEEGVWFDIDADGQQERVAWTRAGEGDGWLVFDRNANGVIDDAGEIFGNHTLLLSGRLAEHGYEALAELDTARWDGNGDGILDAGDMMYQALHVWVDANHDGISGAGELLSLADAGVTAIGLEYVENRRRDGNGNELRLKGIVWLRQGAHSVPHQAYDVFLRTAEQEQ